jgi:ribonuclease-3
MDKMKLSVGKRQLIQRLGYDFNDTSLVEIALSHRSVGANNNERLEFLGDSILNFTIGEALFNKFPNCREGSLSHMRAQMVKGVTLAEIAKEFAIGDNLNLGSGELKSGGHRRESILADTVEALIGAIYIDGGMVVCQQRIMAWYQSRLDFITPENSAKDSKTQLQEYLQGRKKALPIYTAKQLSDELHLQLFEVECEIAHLQQRFVGRGSSRRAAEQSAALAALDVLLGSV